MHALFSKQIQIKLKYPLITISVTIIIYHHHPFWVGHKVEAGKDIMPPGHCQKADTPLPATISTQKGFS